MVINCASEIIAKSEKIKYIWHAAKGILGITDVKGVRFSGFLEKGFGGSQITGK